TKIDFPAIEFDSELVARIFELERLRARLGVGSTPASTFRELHALFQFLMSVVSARIEGNRTTVSEAASGLRAERAGAEVATDQLKEIDNIQRAMSYIDGLPADQPLTHKLVRELHTMAVDGLVREGDPTPGHYRTVEVEILRATHRPPGYHTLMPEMSDFIDFVNVDANPRSQLIHVAIAHHRFLWIHPFRNGNGRVSRLLSYFMLRRHGFVSPLGMRTVNPAAVFGSNRTQYLDALAVADDLSDAGVIAWCEFFIQGMTVDLERVISLQNLDFVTSKLIEPSIRKFHRAGGVSADEQDALIRTAHLEIAKASDLADVFRGSPSQRSQRIRSLVDRGLLVPIEPGARKYRLSFGPNELTGFVVRQLDEIGYLPPMLRDDRAT
ncbi:MAG: Fic family protein, partial [Rhodoglobus sp.]